MTNLGKVDVNGQLFADMMKNGILKLLTRFKEGRTHLIESYKVVADVEFVLVTPLMTIVKGKKIPSTTERYMSRGDLYNIERDVS